ncbi:ER membrane protein complex subunit 8/9 [Phytophthora cinnamomi]|uniref:ER membrane protein complex subunit 8/9 n=1 Tax=Phytophthora cinnamomi TaxID=4785 RepID=UPI00355A7F99|nr:ER membrane protein complex subunit 8/9 [Phytophthora cinnamomi]
MNNLDAVVMASVESAHMCVQAEGINVHEQLIQCYCKNDMHRLGQPKSCKVFYGLDGVKDIGRNVGFNLQDSDLHAPYSSNYWCSYPNWCAQKSRNNKTAEWRAKYDGSKNLSAGERACRQ